METEIRECEQCKALRPDLPPECWQFANESGECPRCTARDLVGRDTLTGVKPR